MQDRLIEVDRGVDDRLLAVVALHVASISRMSRSTSSRYSVRLQVPDVGVASTSSTGGSASGSFGDDAARTSRSPHAAGGTSRRNDRRRAARRRLSRRPVLANFESIWSPPSVALMKANVTPRASPHASRYRPDISRRRCRGRRIRRCASPGNMQIGLRHGVGAQARVALRIDRAARWSGTAAGAKARIIGAAASPASERRQQAQRAETQDGEKHFSERMSSNYPRGGNGALTAPISASAQMEPQTGDCKERQP